MSTKSSRSVSIKSIKTLSINDYPTIRLVHLNSGGWVLISNDYRTKPILGFGLSGSLDIEAIPPGLMSLIDDYKQQILAVKESKTAKLQSHNEWSKEDKVVKEESKGLFTTDIFGLLAIPSRGLVRWNQERNNSNGCNPSYNANCPDAGTIGWCFPGTGQCVCDKKPVGCGAVAMGQIMWYWQYPASYNWSIIPTALYEGSASEPAAELARLLRDCGSATNMNYCCLGSWATTENVVAGFNGFGFNGATKRDRSNWPSSEGWQNLIRAELDAGRPVLYRGGSVIGVDPGDWGNVHYFVCDGYDRNSPSYFHFNWGWGNEPLSDPNNTASCFTLDNLTPDSDSDYSSNQQMIIGISPGCVMQESITSLPYTSISTQLSLSANTISIPESGSMLEIESGGNLIMSATNSITLNPGFYAKAGSVFSADVGPYVCECDDISVLGWTNYFACDGMLCYRADNANTYEFEVFNLSGQLIFQNAGTASDDYERTFVWDGTGSTYGWYVCRITFRNNCGVELYNSYEVFSSGSPGLMQSSSALKEILINDEGTEIEEENNNDAVEVQIEDERILLVPNPNEGRFQLRTVLDNYRVQIFNSYGNLIYDKSSSNPTIDIDLSRYPSGTYLMRLTRGNNVYTRKILKQ